MPDMPSVTIGIPTYMRPELLRRCLESVERQDYRAIQVVVSDNATPGDAVQQVVETFRPRIPRLRLVVQQENVGAQDNFFSILRDARTDYFMWLADDDEISPNYVSSLVGLLERDKDAVSAAGHLQRKVSEHDSEIVEAPIFSQASRWARVRNFAWKPTYYFFYGVHRTETLKKATYKSFWWPNRRQLLGWDCLFLLDVVIDGKILVADDPTVRFVQHVHTNKTWRLQQGRLATRARGLLRRINLGAFIVEKIARRAGLGMAVGALPIVAARVAVETARSGLRLPRAVGRVIVRCLSSRESTLDG